jgi:hypothetical protein
LPCAASSHLLFTVTIGKPNVVVDENTAEL